MTTLPQGWTSANALAIAEPIRGVTYKREQAIDSAAEGYTALLRANNIQGGQLDLRDLVYVPDACIAPAQRLLPRDIVIAMSSGSLSVVGKSAQIIGPIDASFGAFCGVLRPMNGIEARYLGYFLRSHDYRSAISAMARGVNINNLKWSHFERIDIPLAPQPEQTRIANKLDTVLARVDACRDRLDRVGPLLKRFRQSVLAAATTGRLTEDWRIAHGRGDQLLDWKSCALSEVARVIDPNPSHRYPSYENGSVPLLATEQMEGLDGWNTDAAKLTTEGFWMGRVASHGFRADDIVFARKGRLGLARWSPRIPKYAFSHTVFLIRTLSDDVLPAYLLWFLRMDSVVGWLLMEMNSNTGVPTLGKSVMEKLPFRIPSVAEQEEITRRIEVLFAFAERLEARVAQAEAATDRLATAILAKAFRGELVPQDPNDEPAVELLKRLHAARVDPQNGIKSRRSQITGVREGQEGERRAVKI